MKKLINTGKTDIPLLYRESVSPETCISPLTCISLGEKDLTWLPMRSSATTIPDPDPAIETRNWDEAQQHFPRNPCQAP